MSVRCPQSVVGTQITGEKKGGWERSLPQCRFAPVWELPPYFILTYERKAVRDRGFAYRGIIVWILRLIILLTGIFTHNSLRAHSTSRSKQMAPVGGINYNGYSRTSPAWYITTVIKLEGNRKRETSRNHKQTDGTDLIP